MLTKRQERALIQQNAREVNEHYLAEERKARGEYYTHKIIALLGAVIITRGDMQLTWARLASELMDKRDRNDPPRWIYQMWLKDHPPLQAIFWTLFGPDSHSLARYFDHGCVPEWAKESKWTRRGK